MRRIGSKSSHSEGFLETPSFLRRCEVSNNLEAAATPQTETQSSFSQPTPEIQFSLLTPVVYFYTWDHLGTVRLITNSSCAVVLKHDYEPFGVEIPPYNDTASNTHKYTGHERDASTGYDYMHFRFYASSIGRFLKPDNIIPDITNPQNWNAYTYVKGNPVNFNDPSGHTEDQPLQQENKQNQPVGSTQPSTQNIEAMKTQEQKIVAVNKTIAQLIATGKVSSFQISSEVQKALQNNAAFKKGFEAWLTTPTGQQQFQQMSSDKNTSYVVEMGQPSFGARGETIPSYFQENKTTGGRLDVKMIRIILRDDLRHTSDAYLLADTLGHEGFHAEDWGSGKYPLSGEGKHKRLLDSSDEYSYWKMARYKQELDNLFRSN